MRLTQFSDYTLRMLMYAAARNGCQITIDEAAQAFGISKSHLSKVANTLTRSGYMVAIRGRSGGLKLARPPEEIGIGDVMRLTEPDFDLVECFTSGNKCTLTGCCGLAGILGEALASFQSTLDRYSLADIASGSFTISHQSASS